MEKAAAASARLRTTLLMNLASVVEKADEQVLLCGQLHHMLPALLTMCTRQQYDLVVSHMLPVPGFASCILFHRTLSECHACSAWYSHLM